ncbi:MAG TPA: Flp pilus assembly protein CpaB [Gaiellaceae bacterium]|nr:Flp pilus assembly protein CpaB [Gaiellaceae bacterium]
MAYRARNIMIAVALAAVAALLTSFYVTSYKRHVQRSEDHVTVLVAKHDIAQGTTGAEAAGMLSRVQVPRHDVVPGAISSSDQIANLIASQPTLQGEQVTTRRFSPVAENGVRAQIKGTMRAFQIQGDQNQTLAGTLQDGDHVDVVATYKYPDNCSNCLHVTRTVLRNLLVLHAPAGPAVGSKITNGLQNSFSVMLAVTDRQAQKLAFTSAVTSGGQDSNWSLTLRPVAHPADSPESVTTLLAILRDGLTGGLPRVSQGG